MLKSSKLLIVLGLILNGCGSTDNPDNVGGALWSLTGTIEDTSATPRSNVRAAFVWTDLLNEDLDLDRIKNHYIIQDAPITPEFPSSFEINVRELPPADVMIKEEGSGSAFARGLVIFYEDLDQNGALTMVDICAREFVDRVIGYAEKYEVFYFEPGNGDAPPPFEFEGVEAGLNVYQTTANGHTRLSPTVSEDDSLRYDLDASLTDGDDRRVTTCAERTYISASGGEEIIERYLTECGAQSIEELVCVTLLDE